MIKVAVTGANGLIGSRVIELLDREFEFIDIPQVEVDITNKTQVFQKIKNIDFDILLHLAAYTDVDGAEQNKEIANLVNVKGTENLFGAVADKKKKFVYISTDFVFDGEKPPYFEDSTPNPISYYGLTKYEGEKILKNQAMIIRLSYPYRALFDLKKDFVRSIKSYLEQGKTLNMVKDSLITPTFVDDIACALKHLLNNHTNEIFHIIGSSSLSPFTAGQLIAQIFHLDKSLIQSVNYDEYFKNKARRPRYSDMKSNKNNFYQMRSFEEGLNEVVKQLS